jgi:hypothetical protein
MCGHEANDTILFPGMKLIRYSSLGFRTTSNMLTFLYE